MWSIEESAVVKASPERVWSLWTDVAGWSRWDGEVEWSRLDGTFEVGSRGKLKPKGGPTSGFELTRVEPNRGFTDRTKLPLASLTFIHDVQPHAEGARLVHRIELSGPLSGLFARLMGKSFQRGLPEAVKRLARMAEETGASTPGRA